MSNMTFQHQNLEVESWQPKITRVVEYIKKFDSVLIAFSGGVDSSVLLKAAAEALPQRLLAVFARSGLNPPGDLETAVEVTRILGVPLEIMDYQPLDILTVRDNDLTRCYHCKVNLAGRLKELAASRGLAQVLEGSQADDRHTHRPGAKALAESGIDSPLARIGLTKDEIRQVAKALSLPNWDRPGQACLATRFPYGTTLTIENLAQVYAAENLLANQGLTGTRARHHGHILRLEIPRHLMSRLADPDFSQSLATTLGRLGFIHVTVDLAGYRTGVFDHLTSTNGIE